MFGLLPSQGREVPVECMPPIEIHANDEVIATGEYDREGTLVAQSIRKVQAPVPPPPVPAQKTRIKRMILWALLGNAVAFLPLIPILQKVLEREQQYLFLPLILSPLAAMLLARKFRGGRPTERVRLAGLFALVIPLLLLFFDH